MSVKIFTGLGEVPPRGGRTTTITATPVQGTFIKTPPRPVTVEIAPTQTQLIPLIGNTVYTATPVTFTPAGPIIATPMSPIEPILANQVYTASPTTMVPFTPVSYTPVAIDMVVIAQPIEEKRKYSKQSVSAVYNSIFDKFNLTAEPHYNFYVDDEEINDKEVQGYKSPDELPRYVKLTWNKAPLFKLVRSTPEVPERTVKNANDIKQITSVVRNGIEFAVEFLPVKDAKNVTANPFMSPLAIRTNVEIAKPTIERSAVLNIDEDLYLASNIQVPLNELKSNIRSLEQGKPVAAAASELVDGKFSLQRSVTEQTMNLKSGHSSSPSISFASSTAKRNVDKNTSVDAITELVKAISRPRPPATSMETTSTKVTFVEPNITGLVSETKINGASRPEHAETIMALGSMLPAFETFIPMFSVAERENDVPSFRAPQELSGVQYTGYVIEKYKRSLSGIFELVDEFHIDNILQESYIDTEVLYGGTYRYRMKTILCWTREQNIGVAGTDMTIKMNNTSQARTLASSLSTYFDSDWNKSWAYSTIVDLVPPPPPDEINVKPDSRRKRIIVTWKMPEDKQRDISGFILYRKFVTKDKVPLTEWEQISGILPPTNGIFFDTNVEFSEKINDTGYAYALQTVSQHDERSVLSDQLAAWIVQQSEELDEIPTAFLSEAGVDLSLHGAQSVKPMRKSHNDVIVKDVLSLSGRVGNSSNVSYNDKSIIVRLESLDTGEQREVQIAVNYNNVKTITAYERTTTKIKTGKSI